MRSHQGPEKKVTLELNMRHGQAVRQTEVSGRDQSEPVGQILAEEN